MVYPRVGGGTAGDLHELVGLMGLSPRGRGNLRMGGIFHALHGSIPAWAGEPVSPTTSGHESPVYPRVGGGTPRPVQIETPSVGLSPRGRGNLSGRGVRFAGAGSIPAWAGEPQGDSD